MGISTAKTLLSASTEDLEKIFTEVPLTRIWTRMLKARHEIYVARAAAAKAAAAAAAGDAAAAGN